MKLAEFGLRFEPNLTNPHHIKVTKTNSVQRVN